MRERVKVVFDRLLAHYPELGMNRAAIAAAFACLQQCYGGGGKVLICGNGGSAADAEHIVGELMKGFMLRRELSGPDQAKLAEAFPQESSYFTAHLQGALPAISLISHTALSSAFSNDIAPEMVFAQQVYGYGRAGDVLIAISTSGNSKNVVNAVKVGQAFGVKSIGLTGQSGGVMKELCDITIAVPADDTYRIQEYHLPVYHALCAMIEAEFFD